ncbi:hypothetical protein ACP70R_010066 [Stipagrostis hirtigluma subsp. patula]
MQILEIDALSCPIPDGARRLPPPGRSDRRPKVSCLLRRSPRGIQEVRICNEHLPPRSRAPIGYSSRVAVDRLHGSGYSDLGPHSAPCLSDKQTYGDGSNGGKYDRCSPTYMDRGRDYDIFAGSKCSYAEMLAEWIETSYTGSGNVGALCEDISNHCKVYRAV